MGWCEAEMMHLRWRGERADPWRHNVQSLW
jgi:hypothetical protein